MIYKGQTERVVTTMSSPKVGVTAAAAAASITASLGVSYYYYYYNVESIDLSKCNTFKQQHNTRFKFSSSSSSKVQCDIINDWWSSTLAHDKNSIINYYMKNKNRSSLLASSLLRPKPTITQLEDSAFVSRNDEKISTSIINDNGDYDDEKNTTVVLNWSGTHAVEVPNGRYWEPTSIDEVEQIVQYCHINNIPIRPVGSALSPNGISFNKDGMINMSNLDELVSVDVDNNTVTVQAGARVSQVIEMLRQYNLTLPNLASIAEQQMGGFVQVGAHGTGKLISPVDHYVTAITIVTPELGIITLTDETHGELFQLAKVGLGCLGIVVQITMKCIPAHTLVEHTYVLTRQEAKEQLNYLLQRHKHIRYMWIPYTDTVVVVTNDPEHSDIGQELIKDMQMSKKLLSMEEKLKPFTDLLLELNPDITTNVNGMGFGELRDAVLAINPLDPLHVKRCNVAEAEFWKNSIGYQIRPSDELLQFDCGGQQWVWEVCFPTGTQDNNNGNDIKFMEELLHGIEQNNGTIPAHAPIEQRWTASSSSLMSPAHSSNPNTIFSWVGIINYLPSDESIVDPITIQRQRADITEQFKNNYCDLMRSVGTLYGATSHWAKIEIPNNIWKLVDVRISLQEQYPIEKFNIARAKYDPKNILSNPLIDTLLGKPPTTTQPPLS